jgi:hypothetical protein
MRTSQTPLDKCDQLAFIGFVFLPPGEPGRRAFI